MTPFCREPRWVPVRLGLRLAGNPLGVAAMHWFYALWALIGLVLCVVMIAFAVAGKLTAFEHGLKPVALYGFALPLALLAAATWGVKCYSRLLWCLTPEPLAARFLAMVSVLGRCFVLVALGCVGVSGAGFAGGLLLPATVACSAVAWLGLVAEWAFVRVLRNELLGPGGMPGAAIGAKRAAENSTEAGETARQEEHGLLRRDVGKWFKHRFPRAYKVAGGVLLPLVYVVVCAAGDTPHAEAIPSGILRMIVVAPAVFQVFWFPRGTGEVMNALPEHAPAEGAR